jgi:hypothetical protein
VQIHQPQLPKGMAYACERTRESFIQTYSKTGAVLIEGGGKGHRVTGTLDSRPSIHVWKRLSEWGRRWWMCGLESIDEGRAAETCHQLSDASFQTSSGGFR